MEKHIWSPNFDLISSNPQLNNIRNMPTKFHSVSPWF